MATHILAHNPPACLNCIAMDQEITRLRADLEAAYHDPIWNIHNRQGIERRLAQIGDGYAAIVLDIDRMHDANERFGHAGVDWRISQILACIRSDDALIGRWKQGDEIVVFCNIANAEGLAVRLLILFEMHGMSATIALAAATREGIADGIARIEAAKAENRRGTIV